MPFAISQAHVDQYRRDGLAILRGVVPNSLIQDLRAATVDFRERAARDARLGETAQWQLQPIARCIDDLRPFRDYENLEPLRRALEQLLTPAHSHANIDETAGLFFEPPGEPTTTGWHRDWTGEFPGFPVDEWRRMSEDVRFFNQGNCPLYQDGATWLVAGSHLELNQPAMVERANISAGWREVNVAERERWLIEQARSVPRACAAYLEAGDYLLYRNTTWHTGMYASYRRRATIFDFVEHPDYARWRADTDRQWHVGREKAAVMKREFSRV